MLQDYLQAYLPPTYADAYLQIQGMAQWLDVYLSKYLAQYINCMTSDNEFIAFINHAIQLALDLTTYPNIWAVLSILLETQDVNASYMQTMHDYVSRVLLYILFFNCSAAFSSALYFCVLVSQH